jgi:heme exporter protein D
MLGQYAGFIVSAYAAAFIVLALLVLWVWLDHRAQSRALVELEGKGVTRRSVRVATEPVR